MSLLISSKAAVRCSGREGADSRGPRGRRERTAIPGDTGKTSGDWMKAGSQCQEAFRREPSAVPDTVSTRNSVGSFS